MSVEYINIGAGQGIFGAISSNATRELNDHIARMAAAQYGQLVGTEVPYQQARSIYLGIVQRIDDTTKTFIDSSMFRTISPNSIISICNEDSLLKGIPAIMHEMILTYAPIRKAFLKDEIYGFGVNPKTLPIEDHYDRLINNGLICNDSDTGVGYIVNTNEDPDVIVSDLDKIKETRLYLHQLLKDGWDPTDYPSKAGKIK